MRLTRWTLFASLWLLCVGIVAAAAWYAIDSAGRQVRVLASDSSRGGTPRAVTTTAPPQGSSTPALPTDERTSSPAVSPTTPSTSSSTSSSPTSTDAARTSSSSTTTTSSRPSSRTSTTRSPRPQPTTRTTTPTRASSKTVSTRGGSVTVTCRRGDPIDYTVNPAQDWSAQVNQRGSLELEVKLRRDATTIEVHATCVDGEPTTEVSEKSEDD